MMLITNSLTFQILKRFLNEWTLGALTSPDIQRENPHFNMAEANMVLVQKCIQMSQKLNHSIKRHTDSLRARKLPLHNYFYVSLRLDGIIRVQYYFCFQDQIFVSQKVLEMIKLIISQVKQFVQNHKIDYLLLSSYHSLLDSSTQHLNVNLSHIRSGLGFPLLDQVRPLESCSVRLFGLTSITDIYLLFQQSIFIELHFGIQTDFHQRSYR